MRKTNKVERQAMTEMKYLQYIQMAKLKSQNSIGKRQPSRKLNTGMTRVESMPQVPENQS